MQQETLVILKPAGVPYFEEMVSLLMENNLTVSDEQLLILTPEQVTTHYRKYSQKPFFPEMLNMAKNPMWPILVEGEDAVIVVRERVLPIFRKKYAKDATDNALHASDPEENPAEEVDRFFGLKGVVAQWREKHPCK